MLAGKGRENISHLYLVVGETRRMFFASTPASSKAFL
jgi:hypothetical protein